MSGLRISGKLVNGPLELYMSTSGAGFVPNTVLRNSSFAVALFLLLDA